MFFVYLEFTKCEENLFQLIQNAKVEWTQFDVKWAISQKRGYSENESKI